jgi:hypothetical protein
LRSFGEQSPLFSKGFLKENAKLISQTLATPNLIEKCSSTLSLFGEAIETCRAAASISPPTKWCSPSAIVRCDTFQMPHDRGVYVEAKPFSIGFRIGHPQSLIDTARFGACAGNPILGATDYKLVHHASNGRDVCSFCMCPGGPVVAATSEPNRVVTIGMSQYSRAERNANAGIAVGITPEDYPVTLSRRINPESRRRIFPRASPITPSPRSAKRFRHSAARYAASTWRTPC